MWDNFATSACLVEGSVARSGYHSIPPCRDGVCPVSGCNATKVGQLRRSICVEIRSRGGRRLDLQEVLPRGCSRRAGEPPAPGVIALRFSGGVSMCRKVDCFVYSTCTPDPGGQSSTCTQSLTPSTLPSSQAAKKQAQPPPLDPQLPNSTCIMHVHQRLGSRSCTAGPSGGDTTWYGRSARLAGEQSGGTTHQLGPRGLALDGGPRTGNRSCIAEYTYKSFTRPLDVGLP